MKHGPRFASRQAVLYATYFCVAEFWLCYAVADAVEQPMVHLSFDEPQELGFTYGDESAGGSISEETTGARFHVGGMAEIVPGVVGKALRLDGFTTFVEGPISSAHQPEEDEQENDDQENDEIEADGEDEEAMPREITVESWIALGAYPWNWAPILTVGNYKITGFYFGVDSRGRFGLHVSDATSVWHECNTPLDPKTNLAAPLGKWIHVVGTYSPERGLQMYVNGQLTAEYNDFQFDYGIVYSQLEEGYRIGRNRIDLPPSDPIRDWATYPSQYSLDGVLDELKVYAVALTAEEVAERFGAHQPTEPPDLPPRQFPTVEDSGRFAANYTRLKYYPQWDRLWPVGDHLDVVVQFDQSPAKLIFWRGTRYSPCWVSENGKWMADQSRETGNNWFLSDGARDQMPTGCIEHMSDTQCRSSRVRIIESNEARCVVNWQYLQMDVKFRQLDVPNESGFGEWGNEYYYIYPDGIAVRAVMPGYGGWQETIFLNEPGTRPEDNVELAACTLVNLDGESRTYSWEKGYPEFDLEGAIIQMTNLKSKYKPFVIFREGSGFDVFNLEVRPEYSHFPWWNHWPVAQVITDGRSANAPDRAAHSSLSWGDPQGDTALYGMTDRPAKSLATVARSWNRPPDVALSSRSYKSHGYDYRQRAYRFTAQAADAPLSLTIRASEESPLVNLALVIENFRGKQVALSIDRETVDRGHDFRQAIEYDVAGTPTLIVWIQHDSVQPVEIELTPVL